MNLPTHDDALERVIDEIVRPDAPSVDADGTFPRRGIDALGEAGILGLTVAEPFGGGGSLGDAVDVVRRLAGGVWIDGDGGAHALRRDRRARPLRGRGRPQGHRGRAAPHDPGLLRGGLPQPLLGAAVDRHAGPTVAIRLDARKSWITAAGEADSYVWSSRPVAADGSDVAVAGAGGRARGCRLRAASTAWVCEATARRRSRPPGSSVPEQAALGADGAGLDLAMQVVLPWFLVLSGAFSVGLMEAVTAESGAHLTGTRLEHLDQRLVDRAAGPGRPRPHADRHRPGGGARRRRRWPPSPPAGPRPRCGPWR